MPKVVAVIPARKGSKRLPDKNKRMFCGKPLINYTIEEALKCEFIDDIIVSTDDLDIINICRDDFIEAGKSGLRLTVVRRPSELAQDDTPMWKVINHIFEDNPFETIILLLQPTTPLRTKKDIESCYGIFNLYGLPRVISVFREDYYHFKLNGAIYLFTYAVFYRTNKIVSNQGSYFYIMPAERSIDIDTLEEFERAERIMKRRLNKE